MGYRASQRLHYFDCNFFRGCLFTISFKRTEGARKSRGACETIGNGQSSTGGICFAGRGTRCHAGTQSLAREIHDNLGHYLTIVNVQIEAAKVTLTSDPKRALESLNKAQDLAQKGLASVRESVSTLRASPVENRSLDDAISALVAETQTTDISTNFKVLGESHAVDEKVALALYRVVQEGLTNIRKHANASHVDIELDFSHPEKIRLSVRDDGAGAADTSGGFGLVGIRERVQLLGGTFKVETQVGKGFRLEVNVPVAEEE